MSTRSDGARKIGNQRRIELDVEARRPHRAPSRRPDQELFEVLVGRRSTRLPFANAVRLECRGDIGDRSIGLAEADRRVLVEIDDRELAGIALAVCGEEIGDPADSQYLRPMWAEHVTHGVSLAVILLREPAARARHHATGQRSCTIASMFKRFPKRATAKRISR